MSLPYDSRGQWREFGWVVDQRHWALPGSLLLSHRYAISGGSAACQWRDFGQAIDQHHWVLPGSQCEQPMRSAGPTANALRTLVIVVTPLGLLGIVTFQ